MSTKQGDAVEADGYGFNKADDMYGVSWIVMDDMFMIAYEN